MQLHPDFSCNPTALLGTQIPVSREQRRWKVLAVIPGKVRGNLKLRPRHDPQIQIPTCPPRAADLVEPLPLEWNGKLEKEGDDPGEVNVAHDLQKKDIRNYSAAFCHELPPKQKTLPQRKRCGLQPWLSMQQEKLEALLYMSFSWWLRH